MIPKNKRRVITVSGTRYEYCVVGCVDIYIKNLTTNETLSWGDDWKQKWKQSITPKDIRTLIESKELFGVRCRWAGGS
jgi:hypothetical protein